MVETKRSYFGSLESGGQICVGAFGRNLYLVAVKVFSQSIYFIKKFYRRTFNAICKDTPAINCITVQHRKWFIPVNVDGSSELVLKIFCAQMFSYHVQCMYIIYN
jgi:hypothetical protein